MNRCVNLDWLEIYCHEQQDIYGNNLCTPQLISYKGYIVEMRSFGTPTYEQMFTVAVPEDPTFPFLEVRRMPRRDKDGGCFLHPASCHLRLTNKFCYAKYPVVIVRGFMLDIGYIFKSVKRCDICLDFNTFDSGENPQYVLRDFITEKLSKINQTKVSAHGADQWDGRFWNSIRWGAPSSNIATRFYNKSLELKENKMKTWIQDSWKSSGLDLTKPVWRVEFEIKCGQRGFKNRKTQEFHEFKLSDVDRREKLLFIFHAMCNKYFHFKYREFNPDGTDKRKDRCRDKKLFIVSKNEQIFEPCLTKTGQDPTRMERIIMKKLYKMSVDENIEEDTRVHANMLANYIDQKLNGYIFA